MFKLLIQFFGIARDIEDAQKQYGKRWFLSKQLWLNAIAFLILVLNHYYGIVVMSAEEQALFVGGVMALMNAILRFIGGKQPLVFKESDIVDTEKECEKKCEQSTNRNADEIISPRT